MMGTITSTARASFQLMDINRAAAPTITKSEEMMFTKAMETNIFTESISEVRLVRNLAGSDFTI